MANVWQGVPPLGRSPDAAAFATRSRRRRNKLTVLAALGVVVMGAASYAGVRLWDNFTQSLGKTSDGLGRGLEQLEQSMELGGTAADAAASVAASQPPGSLNVASLNAALPKYQWVDSAMNVPYSAKRPILGIAASGTHIETAVQDMDGDCSFGLTITSSTDPLTTEDHLLGLGRYYRLVGPGTYYQSVFLAPQCAADQAPTSGWISWPQSVPWDSSSTRSPSTASRGSP